MALCPFAAQRPVTSHGGPIGTILGVVEHVTAGEGDPYNEFANPANEASSHFGIGNGQGGMADGLLEQYVDTSLMSWAQAAGNGTYISVETEGLPTEALTVAQVATFGKLMAWCNQVHGVPLIVTDTVGDRGLITHGDGGAAWGGHEGCPGDLRKAQRPDILLAAHVAPVPTPILTGEPQMYATYPPNGVAFATDAQGQFYGNGSVPVVVTLAQVRAKYKGNIAGTADEPCVGITPELDINGKTWGYTYITKPKVPVPGSRLGVYNALHINEDGSF